MDSPNTVALTPSHYFSRPGECFRRNRTGDRSRGDWLRADESRILDPEVYWWLREHVGYEVNEVWDVDRFFYPDEELPVVPRGARGEWLRAGRVCHADEDRGENYYSHNRSGSSIYFAQRHHADAFRERFATCQTNWSLINYAMKRRYPVDDYYIGDRVRNAVLHAVGITDQIIRGDGSHETASLYDGIRYRSIVFFFDEENEVLFRIEHPELRAVIVTAREAAAASYEHSRRDQRA